MKTDFTDQDFIIPLNGIANTNPLDMTEGAFRDWLKCIKDPERKRQWIRNRRDRLQQFKQAPLDIGLDPIEVKMTIPEMF